MASLAVMTAVEAAIAAAWTHTPIVTPNTQGLVPTDNTAFLSLLFPVSQEIMKSVGAPGANVWREDGAFRVVLSVPTGTDLNPAATPWASWIDTLRAALRGKVFSGVTTFEASPPAINDESDDGAYFLLSFAVPYWFDVVG